MHDFKFTTERVYIVFGAGGQQGNQHWSNGQLPRGGRGWDQHGGERDPMPDIVREYIMRSFTDRPQSRGRY